MNLQEDLNNFIKSFYGYGNLKSDFWFIGMEEGGGESLEEIKSRLEVWKAFGSNNVIDAFEFHKRITNKAGNNFEFLFREGNPADQRTWRGLIKLLLSYRHGHYSLNEVKEKQSNDWGRLNSDNCLLELFPLPSPNATDFRYPEWFDDENLKTRDTYKKFYEKHRVNGLQQLINNFTPKLVVFYGKAYGDKYKAIAQLKGNDLEEINIGPEKTAKIFVGKPTSYAFIPHPTSPGMSGEYYQTLGEELKDRISANEKTVS
jgi:hypothetical protein